MKDASNLEDTAAYFATITFHNPVLNEPMKQTINDNLELLPIRKKVLLGKQMLHKSTMNSRFFSLNLFGQRLCRPLVHG